jgi:hypothetical protein
MQVLSNGAEICSLRAFESTTICSMASNQSCIIQGTATVQSPGPVVSGKSGRAGESHLRVRCGAAHHNHPAPCITKGKDRFQGGRREGGIEDLEGSCAACDSREYHHGSTCYDELIMRICSPAAWRVRNVSKYEKWSHIRLPQTS